MEIRKPRITESINHLAGNNYLNKIIVVPVFIAHGLHTKKDIPGILGIENDFEHDSHHHHEHGHGHHHHHHHHEHDDEEIEFDGEIILTDPLGIDTRVYEIIKDRISEYQ